MANSRLRITPARRAGEFGLEPMESRLLMRSGTTVSALVRPAPAAFLSPRIATAIRPAAISRAAAITRAAVSASPSAIVSPALVTTATLDTVVFGNTASETAHNFVGTSTQVIAGGVGQSARQMLPLATVGVNGGDMTVTMAVDPVQRNYFSIKLWGSDDTDQGKGRLYLYIPVGGTNYQVGYRHEGDYTPLSVAASKPTLAGRFLYSTTLLPLAMTQGKTSITLKIVSTGELYGLGSGGPPDGNYQMNMDTASRGVYAAYTHTQAMLDVSGETQGTAPATTLAPAVSASSILGPNGSYTSGLDGWVNGRLTANVTTSFSTSDVQMLARAWSVSQLNSSYHNVAVVNKVIAAIDAFASDYFTNPTTAASTNDFGKDGGNEVWGGRFGLLGWAIHLLAGDATMQAAWNQTASFGPDGGTQVRRTAWATMLKASFDSGRFNRDGRQITNQSILADFNIYRANRGLLDLGSNLAVTETAAQRYLKESAGLLPWLGSDLPNGGSSLKAGSNYYQVTSDGLTREWGYAGGYSEMALHVAEMYRRTGNTAFRDQATKMGLAIAYFRRPAIEVSGSNNYRAMEREGVLAWRGVREADGYVADDVTYAGAATWSAGMITAAATGNPTLIGYAKQMLNDNQYLSNLVSDNRFYKTLTFDALNAFEAFDDYNTVNSAPDSGARLPMTAGQPDSAFSDEQDGIVAIKRGSTILYLEPYWQARTGTGVNGVGRFDYIAANYQQYGDFETADVQYTSDGGYFVRPNMIDSPSGTGYTPPEPPTQAYAGEKLPIPRPPADAADNAPFRGKVDFYGVRFGNMLVGINTTAGSSYTLQTPAGFASATDLITGQTKAGTVTVGPNSTVALQLASTLDAAPVPTQPLLLTAAGTPTQVVLNWSAAGGATGYTVKRSAAGGTFTPIATNLTATNFTDTAVTRGVNYAYTVTATNANGQSDASSPARTSAGLPVGWTNADIGTVTLPGSSSKDGDAITVRGNGGDVGGTADSFQFAYATLSGDGSIVARVANAMNTNGSDKLGIMLRESTAAGSKHLDVMFTPAIRTVNLNVRSSTNGNSSSAGTASNINKPYWLKLIRSGNLFTAQISPDGVTWTTTATSTTTMNTSLLAGLFVCSRYSQQLNATAFDHVSVTGAASPAVSSFKINNGSAQRSMINSLTLTFNKTVHLEPGAIVLSGLGLNPADIAYVRSPLTDSATYVLTFTGANFVGGSLSDGSYRLTVDPTAVTDPTTGQALVAGSSFNFFRIFGEGNGNGTVDFNDFLPLQNAFGTTEGSATFNGAFDYDGNHVIDFNDFLAFQNRFGLSAS